MVHGTPIYKSHGTALDDARLNQSIAFRKASSATSTAKFAYDAYEIPHLTKTPWELERRERKSGWKRPSNEARLPQHIFKNLPREVYDCILEQLELQYLAQCQPCPSCYLRDLCSLCATSRAWDRAATLQMYRRVWVITHDDGCRLPKLRVSGTSRLKLLRRTLRERKPLAKVVREIHCPDFQALYCVATIEREEIVNLVASLVMACPNLERLVGFHIPYTHSFDRLSYALSTRPHLKERMWVMADAHVDGDENEEDCTQEYYHAACDPTERFLELNSNQPNLSRLVIHQESAQPTIDLTYRAVVGTIRQLTLLRHLSLSGLSSSSFSNLALNALPPNLQSLRLDNLPGINDRGLQRLSKSHIVESLKRIALINLEIGDLNVIAGFLSPHLRLLESFTLCQYKAPIHSTSPDGVVFQSSTLEKVHWELQSQVGPPPTILSLSAEDRHSFPYPDGEPVACLATMVLAASIEDGLLPALRRIRAPHDPQGVLQALCKPLSTALRRSDASFFTTRSQPTIVGEKISDGTHAPTLFTSSVSESESDSDSTYSLKQFLNTGPDGRTDSVMGLHASAFFAAHLDDTPLITTLAPARSRLAAQARIVAARKTPYMAVRITDPEDNVRLETNIGGFLGDLRSNITYDLKPDRNREIVDEEDQDAHEWITGIDDVMGEWDVAGSSGGCRHAVDGKMGRTMVEVRNLF